MFLYILKFFFLIYNLYRSPVLNLGTQKGRKGNLSISGIWVIWIYVSIILILHGSLGNPWPSRYRKTIFLPVQMLSKYNLWHHSSRMMPVFISIFAFLFDFRPKVRSQHIPTESRYLLEVVYTPKELWFMVKISWQKLGK